MDKALQISSDLSRARLVRAGEDRFGNFKHVGTTAIVFKVSSQETKDLFAAEIVLTQRVGPGKHIHHDQDEWWYVLEGEFIFEVGEERLHLKPGDSLFGPREIPHTFAFVAGTRGRLIGSLMPAGKAEAFFVNADKDQTLLDLNTNLRETYSVEWVGPPLRVE